MSTETAVPLSDRLQQLEEAHKKWCEGGWGAAEAALFTFPGAIPDLIAAVRAGLALADELDEDSRDALKIGAAARDRGDREMHRISARHARVAHHAASGLRAVLTAPLAGQHTTDQKEQGR